MPQPGLVTVIVPVYNGEAWLRECLDSIVGQTYAPLEIIVADDASTDGTREIAASYGPRVRLLGSERNRGIYENANAAIAAAAGEFVAIYHADDIYLPEIVAREVAFLQTHPEAGAVFCCDIFVDAAGREYDRLRLPPEFRGGGVFRFEQILNGLLRHTNSFLRCPGAMVRAETYREVGVYRQDRYRNSADLDMWLRIARQFPLGIIDEHLYQYRHFVNNSSQRYHYLRTDPNRAFRILDDHLAAGARAVASPADLAAYEALRARDAVLRAASHYIKGELSEAQGVLRTARPRTLVATRAIQRWRMLALRLGLGLLTRLPRIPALATGMRRRWHGHPPEVQAQ